MEDWKKAYKAIHGRTPTKKDVTLAPKVLRGESPKNVQRSTIKSKSLKRPMDSSFMSPVKKRRLFDSTKSPSKSSPSKNVTIKVNDKENVKIAEDPPTTTSTPLPTDESINLLSPCKNWAAFRKNASPKKTPQKKAILFDPKSPSPMKPLGKSITCRNIKFLLDVKTPEKSVKLEMEEEQEVDAFEDEKPENARPHREETEPKKRKDKGNFVKVNLRKRNFVRGKPSKFNKKKWLKYKKRT